MTSANEHAPLTAFELVNRFTMETVGNFTHPGEAAAFLRSEDRKTWQYDLLEGGGDVNAADWLVFYDQFAPFLATPQPTPAPTPDASVVAAIIAALEAKRAEAVRMAFIDDQPVHQQHRFDGQALAYEMALRIVREIGGAS